MGEKCIQSASRQTSETKIVCIWLIIIRNHDERTVYIAKWTYDVSQYYFMVIFLTDSKTNQPNALNYFGTAQVF